jgi:L-alanine-DL-glutamate epimerase-like enolase superfamily enzyme
MPPIYHITHLRNLPSIVECGGLWCDGEAASQNLCAVDIAHDHLKARRANCPVPVGPGGVLADYVPFYFAPRSPMLFVIHKGAVAGYQGGQEEVVYLVSATERIAGENLLFTFTDGHAVIRLSRFFDDLTDLDQIDWPLMRDPFWRDTDEDRDRKRRRQAEFLVHRFVPLRCFLGIGVMTQAVAGRVAEILGPSSDLVVKVRQSWYY